MDGSPTSSQFGLHPESYDIMERDREAKIYHRFFRSRVSPTSEGMWYLPFTGVFILSSLLPEPSLVHSGGSLPGASGSFCVLGGGGEQAAGDTEVQLFLPMRHRAETMCEERSRLESSSADLRPQFNRSIYRRNLIIWQLVRRTIIKREVRCAKKKIPPRQVPSINVFYSLGRSIGTARFQVK